METTAKLVVPREKFCLLIPDAHERHYLQQKKWAKTHQTNGGGIRKTVDLNLPRILTRCRTSAGGPPLARPVEYLVGFYLLAKIFEKKMNELLSRRVLTMSSQSAIKCFRSIRKLNAQDTIKTANLSYDQQ